MHNYRDEGIVLQGHKLGEADRIVTVLTRSHGLIRAVAKGIRRTKSRFGSRLEPFMLVDMQCHVGRSLDIVTQVELIEPFAQGIAADYDAYSSATVMAEAAARITEVEPQSRTHFLLLVSAIRSLCNVEHPPRLALDAYLLRAMSVAGWAPSLLDCAQCGNPGPHRAFSASLGGAVCTACRPSGAALPDTDALEHMAALLSGDWQRAESSDLHDQIDGSKLVSDWVSWHLERNIRSLRVLESR
ncbi:MULTISPECIES: DNA repair protein RecO [Brevibacterium]|uniref:DNA repair protein RecO n=2 Tax=Brevibacterium TaxID=1696 RepID=A0A1H1XHT9_BRESA|nr:DNA repair protein RecO [Brevibacterium sandarakinum]SDT08783.1 DNA replication and repair protein RecO [Brevibacterium sandarakinum]